MEGNEVGIKQNSLNKTPATEARNIMQFSSTFIRISGIIPEVKKSALINDIAYSKELK